jgi:CDP-glucose 4,6-dehydratase
MKFGNQEIFLGLKMFNNVYAGKKILITGHTGFKGSWLAMWLHRLGAEVYGMSIEVPTIPSHFELAGIGKILKKDYRVDIKNYTEVKKVFEEIGPEFLFHLAAEPIVKTCLNDPKHAFDTNLGGSVNIFESIRTTSTLRSAVIITSDKCYENVEWDFGYRENDKLGGKDPYSASKACVEIAFSAYFRSYFINSEKLKISTTRAGNVIGGGDWASDRIIPDCIRAVSQNKSLTIRSPKATRPWQLVLEPLSGYLALGARLYLDSINKNNNSIQNGEAFNFGPPTDVEVTVEGVLNEMKIYIDKINWSVDLHDTYAKKEAGLLKLCCDKALRALSWKPTLSFSETIEFTASWYKAWLNGENIYNLSMEQIGRYERLAIERKIAWTK